MCLSLSLYPFLSLSHSRSISFSFISFHSLALVDIIISINSTILDILSKYSPHIICMIYHHSVSFCYISLLLYLSLSLIDFLNLKFYLFLSIFRLHFLKGFVSLLVLSRLPYTVHSLLFFSLLQASLSS